MTTITNVKGKKVYCCIYDEGIMKQIGSLSGDIWNQGVKLFKDEVFKAHKKQADLNHEDIDVYAMIGDVFMVGYLEGIRAERKKKQRK